jgi:Zn-dependent protease
VSDHLTSLVIQFLIAAVPTIMAITLHEAAHGYAAWALGDDTARLAGRLSLNPLRHVDRVGTILLPGFLVISQLLTIGRIVFLFGWAKPVPVSAYRFANPRRGMALVAAAGPAMNFLLAWLAALALHLVPWLPTYATNPASDFVQIFILANLVLGLFNLLPVPPLDGGRIMVGVLPLPLARIWARVERAGILLVLLLILVLPRLLEQEGVHFDPVHDLLNQVVPRALRLVLRMAFFNV